MAEKSTKTNSKLNPTKPKSKEDALQMAMANIEKQFGAGAIMKLGDNNRLNVSFIPTGILSVDIALGLGGIPRGRIVEVYGPESSGKTTVTLKMAASVQKMGGVVAFIDAEHALDPGYAQRLGVNTTELLVSQPDTGEQALEIAETLVRSGAVDLIVVDSVAALVPKAEIEGDMGDQQVGMHARLMSRALRKLAGIIGKFNTTVVFINQLRDKIGGTPGYGGPNETTTGGRALKFFASVRMDVRRQESLKQNDEIIGHKTKVKIVKNKVAPPFKEGFFDMMAGKGISHEGILIDIGIEHDIVIKSGSWFSYGETRLGQGKENVREFLKTNVEIAAEIEKKIKEIYDISEPTTSFTEW